MKFRFEKLILFLSNQCNLRCDYCIVKKGNQLISKLYFEKLVDFLKSNNDFNVIKFFGGEPLMHFYLIKRIVDIFKDRYVREIVTNGYFLSKDVIMYLEKNKFLIYLSEDFEKKNRVKRLIDRFKVKNKLVINITLRPESIDKVINYMKDLYSMWIYNFNVLPIYYKIKRKKSDLNLLKKLFEKLVLLKLKYPKLNYWGLWDGKEKLINEKSLFLSYDWKFYLSDLVENYYQFGGSLKKKLEVGDLNVGIRVDDIENKNMILKKFLKSIDDEDLNKIVDYFTLFYNRIFNGKIKTRMGENLY